MTRRFFNNSFVKIMGKDKIYEIKGYHQNIYCTRGQYIEYNCYELQDVETKEYLNGFVPEDHLIKSEDLKISKAEFDKLLEQFNDHMRMYSEFDDEEYKNQADILIKQMKLYKIE